jgi:Protein of unknown function (DUF1559)
LLQMMVPAVEMSREAARKTQCKNNLRQLGLAVLHHHEVYQRLPSGGWSYRWTGEPERGTDIKQPGSWGYNILPYIEQEFVRDIGTGLTGRNRKEAFKGKCEIAIPVFLCPSRRAAGPHEQVPFGSGTFYTSRRVRFTPKKAGRSDYAASVGDVRKLAPYYPTSSQGHGPSSLEQGDDAEFPWEDNRYFTGVCFRRSQIRFQQVLDGLSKTYLIGEKYVDAAAYRSGTDRGDNTNLYTGADLDNYRTTYRSPFRDEPNVRHIYSFGSPHLDGFHMANCDGSVHLVNYDIDLKTHRHFGNRKDSW